MQDSNDYSFTTLAVQRKVSWIKQFWLIFERSMKFTYRNPKITITFLSMTVFQCILMCSIFDGVGNKRLDMNIPTKVPKGFRLLPKKKQEELKQVVIDKLTVNAQIMKNYVGFNFYCSSDHSSP